LPTDSAAGKTAVPAASQTQPKPPTQTLKQGRESQAANHYSFEAKSWKSERSSPCLAQIITSIKISVNLSFQPVLTIKKGGLLSTDRLFYLTTTTILRRQELLENQFY
jgi:hypothetical protein